MKKLFVLLTAIAALVLMPCLALAAGTVSQAITEISKGKYKVVFTCVGDAVDGSIPDTDTDDFDANGNPLNSKIIGKYLYDVIVDPGVTAPDAADVLIKDAAGLDYMDGSGTNLIHATSTQSMSNSMPFYNLITGALTLDVDNQDTASATYTVTLIILE